MAMNTTSIDIGKGISSPIGIATPVISNTCTTPRQSPFLTEMENTPYWYFFRVIV
jgi:hypothetical protein